MKHLRPYLYYTLAFLLGVSLTFFSFLAAIQRDGLTVHTRLGDMLCVPYDKINYH